MKASFFRAIAFFTSAAVCACSVDQPSEPQFTKLVPELRSALLDAPDVVSRATTGELGRGEEDLLVRLEQQLPGFGGLYIANGQVRAYMKKGTALSAATVRNALSSVYSAHSNPLVRQAMGNARTATVLQSEYSLSELIAIQNRILDYSALLPGFTSMGTNLVANRVVITFSDSSDLVHALSVIGSIGVPFDALVGGIALPVRAATTWQDSIRPTHDGIEMDISNLTAVPYYWDPAQSKYVYDDAKCTLGFNVRAASGADYFMTAGHCETLWRGINGVTGDTAFQATSKHSSVGIIVINPRWGEGAECPFRNRTTFAHYDLCTTADVMLGQYWYGIASSRTMGTSVTGGVNGNSGSQTINNWYAMGGVLTPEYVDSTMHHDAGKSGYKTGTTSGKINFTNGFATAYVCWPTNHSNPTCSSQKLMIWENVASVQASARQGDSGSPVFTNTPGWPAPYAALGILVAVSVPKGISDNATCTSCIFYFSRWDKIQERLGIGELKPNTTIP